MSHPFDQIPHLSSTRWEKASTKAKNLVKGSLVEPRFEDYVKPSTGLLANKRDRNIVIAVLAVVAFAAFWISAGKQISALTALFDPIANGSEHLSWLWADVGIILGLALGELGTIMFSVFASILPGHPSLFRGREIYPASIIFRAFSFMCAAMAILANISITSLHDNGNLTGFAWFLTLTAPIVVIGIGLVIESLVMPDYQKSEEARRKYNEAHRAHEHWTTHPDQHPTYKQKWFNCVYEELIMYQPQRILIEALVAQHGEQVKGALVKRELDDHEIWAALEIELTERPTLPPPSGDSNSSSFLSERSTNGTPLPTS